MIIVMVPIKHHHGHVNLRVLRETNQQLLKAGLRNTSLIDEPGPKSSAYKFLASTLYILCINKFVISHGIDSRSTVTKGDN